MTDNKHLLTKPKKAPWVDFANNELFEGDHITHPDGTEGVIVFLRKFDNPDDQWRVDYNDGTPSRLCLQIGDKGQAKKTSNTA